MCPTRRWLVNLFLGLCPLTGVAIFLAVWWTTRIPRKFDPLTELRWGEAPLTGWFLLPVPTTLLTLIVAWKSRRLLGLFATISLLVVLSLAVVWPRSFWIADAAVLARWDTGRNRYDSAYQSWKLVSTRGRLWFALYEWRALGTDSSSLLTSGLHDWAWTPAMEDYSTHEAPGLLPPPLARLGFVLECQTTWNRRRERTPIILALPFWFLLLLALPAPIAWTFRTRRRRRARRHPGACPRCGYDLRATPDPTGPRLPLCPECGAAT